jgi:hypothetical protein
MDFQFTDKKYQVITYTNCLDAVSLKREMLELKDYIIFDENIGEYENQRTYWFKCPSQDISIEYQAFYNLNKKKNWY